MATMKSSDCRFLSIYKKKDKQSAFSFAADIDYISFIMQYHIGIHTVGTVLWTAEQTIEKYCKEILFKVDSKKYSENILRNKPFGHNLIFLWKEIKSVTKQFSYEQDYEDLVNEISKVTTDTRYMNSSVWFNLGLIETFTVLGCEFRYEILGKKKFMNSFFGIDNLFVPRFFLNNYSYNTLFKKIMHMSIEHGISFSGLGIPDRYEDTGVKLSKATSKFCQCGKHKDIENSCPLCNQNIWQNGYRGKNDGVILKEFFCK